MTIVFAQSCLPTDKLHQMHGLPHVVDGDRHALRETKTRFQTKKRTRRNPNKNNKKDNIMFFLLTATVFDWHDSRPALHEDPAGW